jgi:hypothetical protein
MQHDIDANGIEWKDDQAVSGLLQQQFPAFCRHDLEQQFRGSKANAGALPPAAECSFRRNTWPMLASLCCGGKTRTGKPCRSPETRGSIAGRQVRGPGPAPHHYSNRMRGASITRSPHRFCHSRRGYQRIGLLKPLLDTGASFDQSRGFSSSLLSCGCFAELIAPHTASAGRTRRAISAPRSRSMTAMSYWLTTFSARFRPNHDPKARNLESA